MDKQNDVRKECLLVLMICCISILLTGCYTDSDQEIWSVKPATTEIMETSTQAPTEETKQEEIIPEESENEQAEAFVGAKRMHKYADVLSGFCFGWTPEGQQLEYMSSEETPNQYAIYDVDGDGREELIVLYTESSMAGMTARIYDYDIEKDEATLEFGEFPALTFYDNGAIKADWSHNQGMGPNFWPHNLYSYDPETDSYVERGSVDTWEKQFRDEDYDGMPFPNELDTDGDGILYYLNDGSSDSEQIMVNKAEYEEWYQSVVGDASELEIPWKTFDMNEISSYGEEYMAMLMGQIEEMKTTDLDIGLRFIQINSDIETISNEVAEQTGIVIERVDNPYVVAYTGTIDGVEVYESFDEDAGSVSYYGKAVEGLSLLGVYPGMAEADAQKKLNERGFYRNDYDMYVTGEGYGNYGVYLDSEDGTVSRITIMNYTRYAG